jgi:hypothetical protein
MVVLAERAPLVAVTCTALEVVAGWQISWELFQVPAHPVVNQVPVLSAAVVSVTVGSLELKVTVAD